MVLDAGVIVDGHSGFMRLLHGVFAFMSMTFGPGLRIAHDVTGSHDSAVSVFEFRSYWFVCISLSGNYVMRA